MDNTASQWALTKGYSRDPEANVIVGLFWTSAALLGSHPWFERVGTNAQLADGVSRNDFADAKRLHWKQFDADLTEVWEVLVTSVEQHVVASRTAALAIKEAVDKQRRRAGLPVVRSDYVGATNFGKKCGHYRMHPSYARPLRLLTRRRSPRAHARPILESPRGHC